jgi:hypothetical protein
VVCADCASPWTPGHECTAWLEAAVREPVVPLRPVQPPAPPRLRAQLVRTDHAIVPSRRPQSGTPSTPDLDQKLDQAAAHLGAAVADLDPARRAELVALLTRLRAAVADLDRVKRGAAR